MIVVAFCLVIAGLVMLLKPAAIWALTESWKSNDSAEPSDLYMMSTRFGRVMCILAGIGGMCVQWLS